MANHFSIQTADYVESERKCKTNEQMEKKSNLQKGSTLYLGSKLNTTIGESQTKQNEEGKKVQIMRS